MLLVSLMEKSYNFFYTIEVIVAIILCMILIALITLYTIILILLLTTLGIWTLTTNSVGLLLSLVGPLAIKCDNSTPKLWTISYLGLVIDPGLVLTSVISAFS